MRYDGGRRSGGASPCYEDSTTWHNRFGHKRLNQGRTRHELEEIGNGASGEMN